MVPLIALGQQDGVEVDGPDAVVGFLQPDVVIGQAVREKEQPLLGLSVGEFLKLR